MAKRLKKLGKRNYNLISRGVKTIGTFNPDEIFFMFEEDLYCNEIDIIYSFLEWVYENGLGFGSGNYEKIFSKYLNENN